MGCLYFLENLRFPVVDKLMLIVTQLGEETAFPVAGPVWPTSFRRFSKETLNKSSATDQRIFCSSRAV